MTSEDYSDDSEQSSKNSANGGDGNSKKKAKAGPVDDKMDEEEKRKNFLERNRQGNKTGCCLLLLSTFDLSVISQHLTHQNQTVLVHFYSRTQMPTAQEAVVDESSGQGGISDE